MRGEQRGHRRRPQGPLPLIAALPALLCARPGGAQGKKLDLSWQAPEGCPTEQALAERVARHLGGVEPSRAVKARAQARRDKDVWKVSIHTEIDGQRGSRSLSAASCAELSEATALILALLIDPEASSRAEAPSSALPAASSPPPAPSPASPAPPAPPGAPASAAARPPEPAAPEAPLRPLVAVGAGLGGGLGGPSLWAALGLLGRAVWFSVEAGAGVGETISLAGRPSAGGRLRGAAIEAQGCAAPGPRWAWLCGGGSMRRLSVESFGVSEPGAAARWVPGVQVGARLAARPLSTLLLAADLSASAPLQRPSFVVENAGEVHRPARVEVALRGLVGLIF